MDAKQAEFGKKRETNFVGLGTTSECRLCIYASPMGIWEFIFLNIIGGGTIIFEVFCVWFFTKFAIFFPFYQLSCVSF